ncbi:MAG: hypothetical protein Q9169_007775 [Polycauliona sp. 2 TL-2023]
MLTVVHFFSAGGPRTDVIHTVPGQLADISEAVASSDRHLQLRLVITEDLDRFTYDLLHNVIGLDTRLLDDHRRSGHGPGYPIEADLDFDEAPTSSSSMSVAMPFDLQMGPEIFPLATPKRGNESVEEEVKWILEHHQQFSYLRYDWQPIFIKEPLPALFFNTYKRISFQSIPGPIPTVLSVAVLLYPPLSDLKAFQSVKYKFYVSPDLYFPSTAQAGTPATQPSRIQQLVDHLVNEVGTFNPSPEALARSVRKWIEFNAYKSFGASVRSSGRCWYNVKAYINASSSSHVGRNGLCERFEEIATIKWHQMAKAKTQLRIRRMDDGHVVEQWQRSQSSLRWTLDRVNGALEGQLRVAVNLTQLETALKGVAQGASIKRWTSHTYFYIPISTAIAILGIHVNEYPEPPSIRVVLGVLLPVVIVTLVCSWKQPSKYLRAARRSVLRCWKPRTRHM